MSRENIAGHIVLSILSVKRQQVSMKYSFTILLHLYLLNYQNQLSVNVLPFLITKIALIFIKQEAKLRTIAD